MSGVAREWMEIVAVVALGPPLIAAIATLVSPKQRRTMPGGAGRLFRATWLESFVLAIFGAIAWTVLGSRASPFFVNGGDNGLLSVIVGGTAGSFGLWALLRFPPTSKLLSDHLATRRRARRAKHFRMAQG